MEGGGVGELRVSFVVGEYAIRQSLPPTITQPHTTQVITG